MDELPECKRKRDEDDPVGELAVIEKKAATPEPPKKKKKKGPKPEHLWHFEYDERGGTLEGLFFATSTQIDAAYNKTVDFGEALGKHSEVALKFQDLDVSRVTKDPVLIAAQRKIFEEIGESCIGYNPIVMLLNHGHKLDAADGDSDSSEEEESESESVQCEEPPQSSARVLIGLCKDIGLI